MKRVVIAVVAALSLVLPVSAFAIEGSQPPKETAPNFEQMKVDHLKKLEERMSSLQQEKACVQAANNQDELRACRSKHKAEMKEHRDDMRKRGGTGGPGGQVPPPVK
jgi:septal ring factor EnvC (AmiA/AmiB activator)